MGIERLTIQNFKSYEGTHKIEPFYRFTCIIGPNGSGKSNIVDAFCYVLGVNSSHLRTDNLSTLIHKGKDKCSVTIIIDGISFSRETNKSFKNIYKINEQIISYEEYIQKLQSMKIYVKLKNFVLFQSDISNLAHKTPTELCRIVEEISGSIDFKDSYDLALNNQTKAISECAVALESKKQTMEKLKEIEKGREDHEKFKILSEKRSFLQQQALLYDLKLKSDQINESKEVLKRLEEENKTKDELVQTEEEEIKCLKSETNNAQKKYLFKEAELNEYKDEFQQMKDLILEEESQREKIEWKRVELEQRNNFLNQKIKENADAIKKCESEIEKLDRSFSFIKEEINRKKELFNDKLTSEFEIELKEFNELTLKDQKTLSELQFLLVPLKREKEENENLISEGIKKLKILETKLKKSVETETNLKLRMDKLHKDKTGYEQRIYSTNEKYQNVLRDEKVKNNEISIVMQEIMECKTNAAISESKVKIKNTVEMLQSLFKGVYGRIVDLIHPTQTKYEVAISALLGKFDQAVVVEDDFIAFRCIEYLKERKLCKLVFLPLKSLKLKGSEVIRDIEFFRPAVDVVSYDENYKKAILFLLSNSLISDNIKSAKELVYGNKKVGSSLVDQKALPKIATLDGVIFHNNGLISGGGAKNKFRSKTIEELIEKRNLILKELNEISSKKSQFSDTEIVLERIGRLEVEINGIRTEIKELNINEIRNEINTLNAKIKELRNINHDEFEKLEQEIATLKIRINKKEKKIFKTFEMVGVNNLEDFNSLRTNNAFLQKELENENRKLLQLHRIKELETENKKLEDEIEEFKPFKSNANIDAFNKLKEKILIEERELKEHRQAFEIKKEELNKFNKVIDSIKTEKNEIERKILQLIAILARGEEEASEIIRFSCLEEVEIPIIKRSGAEFRPGAQQDGINHALDSIDFSSLTGIKSNPKEELDAITKKIDELIPNLTNQNLNLLNSNSFASEYEETKMNAIKSREEFSFIKQQRYNLFMTTFKRIQDTISSIYSNVTNNEGTALLVLTNTVEPYLGGIKFMAMPPNKRYREVNLLSGGEKAMASLSLLFSLTEKSPFYIFDEVDSPLDKINVENLCTFYKNIKEQIIVVTHKEQVYVEADALVGVYKVNNESQILTYKFD